MKVGVVRFPGSCDEVDALLAAERVGDAGLLWHGDRDLQDVDAVVIPGGFSYGDYLRAGAIAARAPLMQDVVERAKNGLPVLGICNGFQVLCEAGLLPGALTRNSHLHFRNRDQVLLVERVRREQSLAERLRLVDRVEVDADEHLVRVVDAAHDTVALRHLFATDGVGVEHALPVFVVVGLEHTDHGRHRTPRP